MSEGPGPTPREEGSRRPAVVPRARRRGGEACIPIDRLVTAAARGRGLLLLVAGPGGGKTTALRYLREVLPPDVRVTLCDTHQPAEARRAVTAGVAVLATMDTPSAAGAIDVFALSPWGMDDCLEYLVAVHRGQCASVLGRVATDPSFELLAGVPELVAMVLDEMAADPAVTTARDALRRHAARVVPPGDALDRLIIDGPVHAPLSAAQGRWWRHEGFQHVCTAEWLAAELADGRVPGKLASAWSMPAMVPEIAVALRTRPTAFENLRLFLESDVRSDAASMAATLLLAADPAWRPGVSGPMNLSQAALFRAQWPGIDLAGCRLSRADLRESELTRANLRNATASGADLSGANLRGAAFDDGLFQQAVLRSADLSVSSAAAANFGEADLTSVDLRHAHWVGVNLAGANLTRAQATSADFSTAELSQVDLTGADFTAASFAGAQLREVDLTVAAWPGASFAGAALLRCNLENMELPSADFERANLAGSFLTGSRLPSANFRGADLTRTGLAEVDWPDADLRDVDFTGASFHLGSTRSGLVGSTIAGEGSRTGFYTDDYNDQSYRSPEEIRKACLCGANLTGATVDQTDFYLVDLRRATYTKEQGEHFARTGAILVSREPD